MNDQVNLHLFGPTYITRGEQACAAQEPLRVQPRPLRLLAYLALNWKRAHRREELQDLFWSHKPSGPAANNLRQALWHLRQALPPDSLCVQDDAVQWNPATPPWVDALAFEAALEGGDLDTALNLYAGPFLPDAYDEWAQLERERLRLRYLGALEMRAERRYEARQWEAALSDAETLLAADSLNEAAARLVMACHWALGQRESARRCYDTFRQRARAELQSDPLPETTTLYQRILRGEAHPEQLPQMPDAAIAAQRAHLSLLETLGAFRQGLERATTWGEQASGHAQADALRWQGRFHIRLGQCEAALAALTTALPLANAPDLQALILSDLAAAETGIGDYPAAETHYVQALRRSPLKSVTSLPLLGGLGGLLARMGRLSEARVTLEQAARLARDEGDPASLAIACSNLGILLIGQKETDAAKVVLQEAQSAARHTARQRRGAGQESLHHLHGRSAQHEHEVERVATRIPPVLQRGRQAGVARGPIRLLLDHGSMLLHQSAHAFRPIAAADPLQQPPGGRR